LTHDGYQGLPEPPNKPAKAGSTNPKPPPEEQPTPPAEEESKKITVEELGDMAHPLNAQPTGHPGQQGCEQANFTAAGLRGNAVIPWAMTKDEKHQYDAIFRASDGMNKGFIAGPQAVEIFDRSGLERPDLERIWTLADNGNKGRLDLDEFAVAMHLIYMKLNGYPVPNTLPPELVLPST